MAFWWVGQRRRVGARRFLRKKTQPRKRRLPSLKHQNIFDSGRLSHVCNPHVLLGKELGFSAPSRRRVSMIADMGDSPPPTPRARTPNDGERRFKMITSPCEWIEDYRPGGYHPVHLGDVFNDGQYRVIRKLGDGAYSTVWLARDLE